MTVHRRNWVCHKADWYIHPDHETDMQFMRRQWWAVRSLLAVRAELAATCRDVAAGTAREKVVIRETEFTTRDHRPMALRILLAECTCCPDPLEPIVPTDPVTAEIVHAANVTALGRLRWHAENDGALLAVFAEYDTAVAGALDIEPGEVPALTATEPHPTADQLEFEKLLDASSLGPVPPASERVQLERETAQLMITGLLKAMVHGQPDDLEHKMDRFRRSHEASVSQVRPLLAELLRLIDTRKTPPELA